MKRRIVIPASIFALSAGAVLSAIAVAPFTANAASTPGARAQTATLAVDKMTCATCPITVKKAMQGVAGVSSVVVDLATKRAKVVFDPKRTNVATIAAASTNAGFPAKPAS